MKSLILTLLALVAAALIGFGCSTQTPEIEAAEGTPEVSAPTPTQVELAPGGADTPVSTTEPVVYKENGKAVCVVMKTAIEDTEGKAFQDHEGVRYYFCCDGCPQTFAADPAKYAKKPE